MKTYFLLFTLTFFISQAVSFSQESPVEKLFDKYNGKEGFTSVNIDKDLFEAMSPLADKDSKGLQKAVKNLKGIKILTYTPGSIPKNKRIDFYKEVINTLPLNEYKNLMNVESSDSKVKFLIRKKNDRPNELLMITGEDSESTLIWMSGDIDLKNIKSLTKDLDIKSDNENKKKQEEE